MAEEMEDAVVDPQPAEESGGRRGRLLLFGGIALGQVAIAIALAHFVILPRLPDTAVADSLAAVQAAAEEAADAARPERGTIMLMEDLIVNLVDDDGTHFLKMAPGLEFSEAGLEEEITERMPELRGAIIDHFSSRSVQEMVSKEGRDEVKRDLLVDLNSRLTQGQLLDIYFSDFVVQ